MIIIINMNMSIDKTFYIDGFKKGFTFRKNPDVCVSGGKGVNVARVLKIFTDRYKVYGFCFGFNGMLIKRKLKEESINNFLVYRKNGESRVCVSVVDKNGVSTDINEEGPEVERRSVELMVKKLRSEVKRSLILVISGRTIKGIDDKFYRDIVSMARSYNVDTYIDTTHQALRSSIVSGASVVKINSDEFKEFSGLNANLMNVKKVYNSYRGNGLKSIIVTNKEKKTIAVVNGKVYEVFPPPVKEFVCGVGAGDSFMAGLIYSNFMKKGIVESLKFASACAASDCKTLGAGMIKKSDIDYFMDRVVVKIREDI